MRRKKCTKTPYATIREAEAAIEQMGRRFRFTFKRAYRCGQCRAWHITSKPTRKGRRKQW